MSRESGNWASRIVGSREPDLDRAEVLTRATQELWPPSSSGVHETVRALLFELERVRVASQEQAKATSENTTAVLENTAVQTRRPDGITATAGRALMNVFTGSIGLSPLLTGLARLFRGQDEPKIAPLTRYVPPPAIHYEGYITRTMFPQGSADPSSPVRTKQETQWQRDPDRAGGHPTPVNITVQVQAIDSRSFLDHSWEIARAVKEAMLESHALNDVVADL